MDKEEIKEMISQVYLSGHSMISELLRDLYFRLESLEKEVKNKNG